MIVCKPDNLTYRTETHKSLHQIVNNWNKKMKARNGKARTPDTNTALTIFSLKRNMFQMEKKTENFHYSMPSQIKLQNQ